MEHENQLWRNGIRVSREDVVSNLTPIPEQESRASEIAQELSNVVIGQEKAMQAIARRVTLAEAGFNDPFRPLSTMFLLGPTGVGKSESAHALAEYMFEDPQSEQLRIIDCAEYSQSHMISRLLGSPPGYVGYESKTMVDEEFLANTNIIVFDEIEKAHPDFHKLLLGIMDRGQLSIKRGAPLNFSRSHIMLTSNIGASEMQKARRGGGSIGFGLTDSQDAIEDIGMNAVKAFFKHTPEFLGRVDEIITFDELSPEHYEEIFWKFMEQKNMQIEDRLGSGAPFIAATPEAQDHFIALLDRTYGARELRGIMEREIFYKVADLSRSFNLSSKGVVVDVENGESIFYTKDIPQTRESFEKEFADFFAEPIEETAIEADEVAHARIEVIKKIRERPNQK